MWSLGVRPAYHVRNLVGNIWNAYSLAGVKNPEVYRQAAMIQNQASRNLLSETEKIGGYTHRQLYDEAIERGIIGRGQYGADVTKTLERTLEGQTGRAGLGGMAVDFMAQSPYRCATALSLVAWSKTMLGLRCSLIM